MEFSFQVTKIFDVDKDGIAILHSSKLNPRGTFNSTPFYMQQFTPSTRMDPNQEKLSEILDKLGEASSKVLPPYLEYWILDRLKDLRQLLQIM